ncbi:hypothetical protein B0H13DRAFT_720629 [Mycena leptocephala]|nr:hypothetical protein B0H13DRAFT_720629 [Mycena leptocephala]
MSISLLLVPFARGKAFHGPAQGVISLGRRPITLDQHRGAGTKVDRDGAVQRAQMPPIRIPPWKMTTWRGAHSHECAGDHAGSHVHTEDRGQSLRPSERPSLPQIHPPSARRASPPFRSSWTRRSTRGPSSKWMLVRRPVATPVVVPTTLPSSPPLLHLPAVPSPRTASVDARLSASLGVLRK